MNLYAPFLPVDRLEPDMNQSDRQSEVANLLLRCDAVEDVLDGKQSADYLLDLLESQGIDPLTYVQEVEGNVQSVISLGAPVYGNEPLIWTP